MCCIGGSERVASVFYCHKLLRLCNPAASALDFAICNRRQMPPEKGSSFLSVSVCFDLIEKDGRVPTRREMWPVNGWSMIDVSLFLFNLPFLYYRVRNDEFMRGHCILYVALSLTLANNYSLESMKMIIEATTTTIYRSTILQCKNGPTIYIPPFSPAIVVLAEIYISWLMCYCNLPWRSAYVRIIRSV